MPITELEGYRLESELKRFLVPTAQVSNSGRYTCVAVNEAGEARRSYDLQVQGQILYLYTVDYFMTLLQGG